MILLKEIVQSGVLGKIYYIQTGGGRRRGIPTPFGTSFIEDKTAGLGALADIGCYSLDMVLNALGNPKPLTVSGYKSAFFGQSPDYIGYKKCGHPEYHKVFEVDDFAAAFIRMEGDLVIDFCISWAMNMDTSGDTLILGTKGGLRIPSTECWGGSTGGPMTLYHEVDGKQVETVIPELPHDNLFLCKLRAFVEAIKSGKKAPIPTSEILYNQAIIDAVVNSAALGREVEIVIPEI
jgi:predicted dehydrogenase